MLKLVLVLMLLTTQLLAGAGGSVYLCISNDGSFFCIDRGPSTCNCRGNRSTEDTEEDYGCKCNCHAPESCDECNHSREELLTASGDPSGCTHILLSRDQAAVTVARTSSSIDVDRIFQLVADLSGMLRMEGSNDSRHSPHERFRPPTVPSQTMTVLAWVLIQC